MAEYTLFTGGANGSDLYWQEEASKHGMAIRIMSFQKHKRFKVPGAQVEVFTTDQLKEADQTVEEANKRMKRTFPCRSEYDSNLIRRNYHIIKDADAVLAIGKIGRNAIQGGTAWGVVMADILGKPAYIYDMRALRWYEYKNGALNKCSVPTPSRNFAGIGSRNVSANGKSAIQQVFEKLAAKHVD